MAMAIREDSHAKKERVEKVYAESESPYFQPHYLIPIEEQGKILEKGADAKGLPANVLL
jgi:hypothetical protein